MDYQTRGKYIGNKRLITFVSPSFNWNIPEPDGSSSALAVTPSIFPLTFSRRGILIKFSCVSGHYSLLSLNHEMIMKLIFNFVFLFDILLEQQIKMNQHWNVFLKLLNSSNFSFYQKHKFNLRVLKSCHSVTVSQHRLVEAGPNDIIECWPYEMRYVMCGGGQWSVWSL